MDRITLNALQGAAGAAGAAGVDKVYVDDVFSTYLYVGTGSAQTIDNGIDLDGEGGLIWTKWRSGGSYSVESHALIDTDNEKLLRSNTDGSGSSADHYYTFQSTGYQIDTGSSLVNHDSGGEYCSWTFRKAPGFFDVVTYTGDANAGRTIAHNLGSVPGMVIIKSTSTIEPWAVWHRSLSSNSDTLRLNEDWDERSNQSWFNSTAPTSSVFTVGAAGETNNTNVDYVAYLFAHDDQQFGTGGDESIIKCGEFDAGGSGDVAVTLGFEPQWLLIKKYSSTGDDWIIHDHMRGFGAEGGTNYMLRLNSDGTEVSYGDYLRPSSDGFIVDGASMGNYQYVYMAIRRPHKKPAAATEVFSVDEQSSGSGSGGVSFPLPSFPLDCIIAKRASSNADFRVFDRIRGYSKSLITNDNSIESTETVLAGLDQMSGYTVGGNGGVFNHSDVITYSFKRAPGFFDVVAYAGNYVDGRNVPHNLGVIPELMIVKGRGSNTNPGWYVYHKDIFISGSSYDQYIFLNSNDYAQTASSTLYWNQTRPTSSVFTLGEGNGVNQTGYNYIAYLFATLPGISKVGSYTGTGNDIDVDCGFTSGARFVLVKRTDSTGDWYLWDTERGITAGDDPHVLLNELHSQVSNNSNIDPHNPGFQITDDAPDALNASGGTYIYLAIA